MLAFGLLKIMCDNHNSGCTSPWHARYALGSTPRNGMSIVRVPLQRMTRQKCVIDDELFGSMHQMAYCLNLHEILHLSSRKWMQPSAHQAAK